MEIGSFLCGARGLVSSTLGDALRQEDVSVLTSAEVIEFCRLFIFF